MKVVGFNGRSYSISVKDHIVFDDDTRKRSEPHTRARKLLKELFPCSALMEEVTLPGSARGSHSVLYADFILPSEKIMIEVHGEQHYSYSSHYHGDKAGFEKSKVRDVDKQEWCYMNNIKYIELPHGENEDEWRKRIRGV